MVNFKRLYQFFKYQIVKRNVYALTAKSRALPDFIIIGAMKSGTTSLYHYICEHPSVLPAAYDEIGFFDNNYHLGLNWYRSMFPTKRHLNKIKQKNGIALTGEDTPFYFWNNEVCHRIKELLPTVKLILILRNPVDRAFSEYNNGVRNGKIDASFESFIKQDLENLSKNKPDITRFNDSESIISRGVYWIQLDMWRKLFSKDQILVLQSEKLLEFPDDVLNEVFNFLGLSKFDLREKLLKKKFSYSKMNEDTRKKLIEFYHPYNEQLYEIIEKKYDWR